MEIKVESSWLQLSTLKALLKDVQSVHDTRSTENKVLKASDLIILLRREIYDF